MVKKIPTKMVDKSLYKNYWKKALELRETMIQGLVNRNWNAVSLNAVHAVICANDAVLVCFYGARSTSSKHDDAVSLLRSLMKDGKAKSAANHLSKLIYSKNLIEYESRLFSQSEAYSLTKHAERFLDWVESILP